MSASGLKRTWRPTITMSAFDPKRTSKPGVFGAPASQRLICSRLRSVRWRSCRHRLRTRVNTRARGKFSIGRNVARNVSSLSILGIPKRSFDRPHDMPKFLRIGVHQSNVSGYTSKAWWVRRVGSTVFLKWGAVEVQGVGDGRKVYWALPPQAKTIRCGTEQRAKDYA